MSLERPSSTDPAAEPASGMSRGFWLLALIGAAAVFTVALSPRRPPPPSVEQNLAAWAGSALPAGAATADATGSATVVMYSTSWCGYCKRARAWFSEQGITYVDRDIEHDAAASERMRAINPGGGVPTFEIGERVVMGFSPGQIQSAIAALAPRPR